MRFLKKLLLIAVALLSIPNVVLGQQLVLKNVLYSSISDRGVTLNPWQNTITFDSIGNLYFGVSGAIRVYDSKYAFVKNIILPRVHGEPLEAQSITVAPDMSVFVVAKTRYIYRDYPRLYKLESDGFRVTDIPLTFNGSSITPTAVCFQSSKLVVGGTTTVGSVLVELDPVHLTVTNSVRDTISGYAPPLDIAVTLNGEVYITNETNFLKWNTRTSEVILIDQSRHSGLEIDSNGDVIVDSWAEMLRYRNDQIVQRYSYNKLPYPFSISSDGRRVLYQREILELTAEFVPGNTLISQSSDYQYFDGIDRINVLGAAALVKSSTSHKLYFSDGAVVPGQITSSASEIYDVPLGVAESYMWSQGSFKLRTWLGDHWLNGQTLITGRPRRIFPLGNGEWAVLCWESDRNDSSLTSSRTSVAVFNSELQVLRTFSPNDISGYQSEYFVDACSRDGQLIFLTRAGGLLTLSPTGALIQKAQLSDMPTDALDLYMNHPRLWPTGDGNFVLGSANGYLMCFDHNGRLLFNKNFGSLIVSASQNGRLILKTNYELLEYTYVAVDSLSPSSTGTLSPSPTEFGWTRTATTLTITSTDKAPSAGFKELHYTVDSGTEQVTTETTKSLSFDDGVHQIAYWGVDIAGNIEATQYAYVRIDKVRPVTTRTVNATDTLLTLTPNDNASGIAGTYYSVDGAPQQLYSGPITLDGKQHRIVYWSVDKAGNVEYVNTALIGVAFKSITECRFHLYKAHNLMGLVH